MPLVITTATGGLVDFFRNGEMGYMVPTDAAHRSAAHMRALLADPDLRKRIGTFNREYARRNFKASAVSAALLQTVQSIAEP